MQAWLRHWISNRSCLLCSQPSAELLCEWCSDDLPLIDWQACHHNLMLKPDIQWALHSVKFPHLLALATYQAPLDRLLLGLKFGGRLSHANALARVFSKHAASHGIELPQALVPVPLHWSRWIMRRFNQSVELAEQIGERLHIPVRQDWVWRAKRTTPQVGQGGTARRRKLNNAFALHQVPDVDHIALVDDVVTTGSTLQAIYHLLHSACPHIRIDCWAIAIAPTLTERARR